MIQDIMQRLIGQYFIMLQINFIKCFKWNCVKQGRKSLNSVHFYLKNIMVLLLDFAGFLLFLSCNSSIISGRFNSEYKWIWLHFLNRFRDGRVWKTFVIRSLSASICIWKRNCIFYGCLNRCYRYDGKHSYHPSAVQLHI